MWLQIWLGYQQVLRPCEGGLTLNVDTVATPFIEEASVVDFLAKGLGMTNPKQLQHMTPEALDRANKLIAGIKVRIFVYVCFVIPARKHCCRHTRNSMCKDVLKGTA